MQALSQLPERLVRYRPADNKFLDAELKNLAEGNVFLQKLSCQNDGTEGKPQLLKCSTAELIDLSRRLIRGAGRRLGSSHELCQVGTNRASARAYLANRRKWQGKFISIAPEHIRIACFSNSVKDNEKYMWRKYGSNGRGFRLLFDFDQNASSYGNSFWAKVHYSQPRDRRKISEAELIAAEFQVNGADIFSDVPEQWIGILQAFAACKPQKWEEEDELRLIKFSLSPSLEAEDSYFALPAFNLSGVTFGWNIDRVLAKKVKQALGDSLAYSFQQAL
ncbi:DUF2971 domain-containing protein [Aliisedimentitalea scapharcae]|uniref:DUF2971 domain-containing protein n=1 Tax=Aliisedimentitalea scapharcae TaxID=1524259 RepID=A0ABZ2Y114_9RHOB